MIRWLAASVLVLSIGAAHAHVHGVADAIMLALTNKNKISCCDQDEAIVVEEQIRNGKYWVSFCLYEVPGGCGQQSGWFEIPDEALVLEPNHWGRPMIWGSPTYDNTKFTGFYTRCYLPGPGA